MIVDPVDEESIASIVRITGCNFHLLYRLLAQSEQIARINGLDVITRQVQQAPTYQNRMYSSQGGEGFALPDPYQERISRGQGYPLRFY